MDIKNKKGFTLIELLVVIAIIGILASVTLVSLSNAREKAKLSKALSAMKSISKIAEMCVIGGGTLTVPASNGLGGSAICSSGTETLPDISDMSFQYCGTGCGGWISTAGTNYAMSIYSDSYSSGRKIVVCGMDANVTGWYYSGSPFNFIGTSGCKTDGF